MQIETQPQRFWEHLSDALAPQEGYYNLILGLVSRAAQQQTAPGLMASLSLNQNTLFLVESTHGRLLLAGTQAPEALRAHVPHILNFIQAQQLEPAALIAPRSLAQAFAQAAGQALKQKWSLRMAQGVYQLEQVISAPACAGHLRLAQPADSALLSAWHMAFVAESLPYESAVHADAAQAVQRQIEAQQIFVWEQNGQLMSMAARLRETPQGTALSLVYTPPEWRGQGYASACVAALSQLLLDSGKRFCCLFTDLSNATSNHIYQRIGYLRLGEFAHYERTIN